MIIEIIKADTKRMRLKCKIDNKYYNLPKGLVTKLYDFIYSGEQIDFVNEKDIGKFIKSKYIIQGE